MGFTRTTALLFALLAVTTTSAAAGPAELAKDAGCGMCHAADKRMLGPSYKEIAERYAGDEAAAERLFAGIREGVRGNWGGAPMMAVDSETIGDDDLRTVIAWILASQ